MVAGNGSIAVDEIIGHEVDIVDQGGYILPADGSFQIVGIGAGGVADLVLLAELLAEQADEGGEMVFVLGVVGIAGDVDEGGIFPVEVNAVGVEVAGELFDRTDKLGSSLFG